MTFMDSLFNALSLADTLILGNAYIFYMFDGLVANKWWNIYHL